MSRHDIAQSSARPAGNGERGTRVPRLRGRPETPERRWIRLAHMNARQDWPGRRAGPRERPPRATRTPLPEESGLAGVVSVRVRSAVPVSVRPGICGGPVKIAAETGLLRCGSIRRLGDMLSLVGDGGVAAGEIGRSRTQLDFLGHDPKHAPR